MRQMITVGQCAVSYSLLKVKFGSCKQLQVNFDSFVRNLPTTPVNSPRGRLLAVWLYIRQTFSPGVGSYLPFPAPNPKYIASTDSVNDFSSKLFANSPNRSQGGTPWRSSGPTSGRRWHQRRVPGG